MAKKTTTTKPKLTDAEREAVCKAIPQKLWRQWSDRQWKTLSEQSRLYGFPMGATIKLPEFVRWFHDFLSENARKLNAKPAKHRDDTSPELEAWRRQRRIRETMLNEQLAGALVPLEFIETFNNRQAELILRASRRLDDRFGPAAGQVLRDCIDNLERLVAAEFGGDEGNDTEETDEDDSTE